jgi:predicted RNA-binding protein YlqC (UPF0109 family)
LSGVLRKPILLKFRLGNLIFSEADLFYSFGLVEVTMLKELIELIAKALVDHPEQVEVSELEGEQTSVIELRVAKEDLGKVIGKQGRTARAMRTILSAASTKIRKRAVLEIIE